MMRGFPLAPLGRVEMDGATGTLRFERYLPHPASRVWTMLTDPGELRGWYMTRAIVDGRPGGRIEFWVGPAQFHVTGRILAWDPPKIFEHEWNADPRPELPRGERGSIRWELIPEGAGTLLRLTHSNLTTSTATGFAPGTHVFLDRLEAALGGTNLPDWPTRYAELVVRYPPREPPVP